MGLLKKMSTRLIVMHLPVQEMFPRRRNMEERWIVSCGGGGYKVGNMVGSSNMTGLGQVVLGNGWEGGTLSIIGVFHEGRKLPK